MPSRTALEVADLFRRFGPRYRRDHALSGQQFKVMRAIEQCRTAALGGHLDQCDRCDHLQISYNSCGNRHCPKCQGLKQLRWIEARKQQLLPIEYFPVGALSQVFRGKYLDGLRQAYATEAWVLTPSLAEAGAFQALLGRLKAQDWVVYAKRPFAGPEQVVEYLGRYTHRVALSNRRLVALDQDRVCFRWKDYRAGGQPKVMTLSVAEFIRRFLLHVLPRGFVRLRHYGLLANTVSERCLATCRVLLEAPMAPPAMEARSYGALLEALLGVDVLRCPVCGQGRLQRLGRYPAGCDPPGQTMGQAA